MDYSLTGIDNYFKKLFRNSESTETKMAQITCMTLKYYENAFWEVQKRKYLHLD